MGSGVRARCVDGVRKTLPSVSPGCGVGGSAWQRRGRYARCEFLGRDVDSSVAGTEFIVSRQVVHNAVMSATDAMPGYKHKCLQSALMTVHALGSLMTEGSL